MRAPRILRAATGLALSILADRIAVRRLAAARRDAEAAQLLYGIRAVARFLGLSKNQARALARRGAIPTFDLDGVTCARRSTMLRHLAALEAGAGAGAAARTTGTGGGHDGERP